MKLISLLAEFSPSLDATRYQSRISKAKKKAGYKPRSLAQAEADAAAEEDSDPELIEFELEMEEKSLTDGDRLDRMAGYSCCVAPAT